MILDSTGRSLEVVLAAAIATSQPQIVADWVDMTATATTGGSTRINANSTTAVTAVAAPAASTQRKINTLTIYNADTADAIATVRYNDSSTLYKIVTYTVPVGRTLQYTDTAGWALVSSTSAIGPAGPTGPTGATGPAASHVVTALGITSGVMNIDLSLGDLFYVTLNANVTSVTFSSLPGSGNGQAIFLRIQQDGTGARTFAIPSSWKAITGSDVAIQAGSSTYTCVALTSVDDGTRWEYVMKAGAA